MTFNTGYLCKSCGPVKEMEKKTVRKASIECCKACGGSVTKWSRPLNERAGRCNNCSYGSFELGMGKGKMKGFIIRKCKKCHEISNGETGDILIKGKEEFKYVI